MKRFLIPLVALAVLTGLSVPANAQGYGGYGGGGGGSYSRPSANPYRTMIEIGGWGATYDFSNSTNEESAYGFAVSFGWMFSDHVKYLPTIEWGTFGRSTLDMSAVNIWLADFQLEFGESTPRGGGVGFGFFVEGRTGFAFLLPEVLGNRERFDYLPWELGVGVRLYFGMFFLSFDVYGGYHIGVGSSLSGSPEPDDLGRAGGTLNFGFRF